MLKFNYEGSFKAITDKITTKQGSQITSKELGGSSDYALSYFYSFIILDCIDNLQSNSNDTETMNDNLNFLQTQLIF